MQYPATLLMAGPFVGLVTHRGPNYFYILSIILTFIISAVAIGIRASRGNKIPWRGGGRGGSRNIASSPDIVTGLTQRAPAGFGAMCPRCGKAAGGGAITCSACGGLLPETSEPIGGKQAHGAEAPAQPVGLLAHPLGRPARSGNSEKCPSCGLVLAPGARICPRCDWRIHGAAGACAENPIRIGVVRHDVMVAGALAFKKNDWVRIEGESPDPNRPEYKYIVLSGTLGGRFRLSDQDIAT